MTQIYSGTGFRRKIKTIKDWLRDKDDFYADTLLTRVVVKTDSSGVYNRNVTISHTDTTVSGVAVYRPEYVTYDEEVKTIDADVQFTCKSGSKATILAADELWLNYTLSGSAVSAGTLYKIQSDRPTLFELDHIFDLVIAGKQSG